MLLSECVTVWPYLYNVLTFSFPLPYCETDGIKQSCSAFLKQMNPVMSIWKHEMLKNRLCFKKCWEGERGENFSNSASFDCKCATLLGNFFAQAEFQLPSKRAFLTNLNYSICKGTPLISREQELLMLWFRIPSSKLYMRELYSMLVEMEILYKWRFLWCFSQVLLKWMTMPNIDQISLDKSFYSWLYT